MSRIAFDTETLGAPQEEVAYRLRAVREAMGLSLRSFAKRLSSDSRHVSHTAVMKYERLELKITPDYLDLVARRTHVPYGWFLSGIGSEDSPLSAPVLLSAGLESLPSFLHRSVTERMERLADWCGVPPGPTLEEFYGQVGRILLAPFTDGATYFRSWSELTEREMSVYVASQFATLRTLLRRLGELDEVQLMEEARGEPGSSDTPTATETQQPLTRPA